MYTLTGEEQEVVSSQRGSQGGQPLPRPPVTVFLVTATCASAEPQTNVVLAPQSGAAEREDSTAMDWDVENSIWAGWEQSKQKLG